jgi:hypothetical protein
MLPLATSTNLANRSVPGRIESTSAHPSPAARRRAAVCGGARLLPYEQRLLTSSLRQGLKFCFALTYLVTRRTATNAVCYRKISTNVMTLQYVDFT